jgi:hypothetical protein
MTKLAAISALLCVCGGIASAQPDTGFIDRPRVALEIDDCGVKPEVGVDQLRSLASEHYQRGEVLYVQGDYPGAVSELVASYCLLPYFSVLKDIGQAYERQLDYPRAIGYLSRYLKEIPDDAKQTGACGVDPQSDRATVSSRIQVLEALPARVLVDTQPADATITLTSEAGVSGRAKSGEPIEVRGGRYQMVIERAGYKRVEKTEQLDIGKPYTLSQTLEPLRGRLHVQVVPSDGRIFVDNRFVGIGQYEAVVPGATYQVTAEADGHVTETHEVTVTPDTEADQNIELELTPQTGRRQLLLYASIAGPLAGTALLAATGQNGWQAAGFIAGLAGGVVGGYLAIPHDLPLGTSSLTITSSLAGATAGVAGAYIFSNDDKLLQTAGGVGAALGAGVGYYLGDRLDVKPGDAALVNSGLAWGAFTGALFTVAFDSANRVSGGLVLAGLGMGGIGGGLLAHTVPVSRTHALLIDVSGAAGVLGALAIESLVYQSNSSDTATDQTHRERLANFGLGGMAIGLIVGGVLTRNLDAPKLNVAPSIGGATTPDGKTTMTFGFGGVW